MRRKGERKCRDPKNRRRRCSRCDGRGACYSDDRRETCGRCHGSGRDKVDRFDWVPREVWQALNFKVVHSERRQSWVEQYIGFEISSCMDYGAHKRLTDAQLISEIRNEKLSTQACRITQEDGTLCDAVLIITAATGYSLVAAFADKGQGKGGAQ